MHIARCAYETTECLLTAYRPFAQCEWSRPPPHPFSKYNLNQKFHQAVSHCKVGYVFTLPSLAICMLIAFTITSHNVHARTFITRTVQKVVYRSQKSIEALKHHYTVRFTTSFFIYLCLTPVTPGRCYRGDPTAIKKKQTLGNAEQSGKNDCKSQQLGPFRPFRGVSI